MAIRPIDLFEKTRRWIPMAVVDRNGDPVPLTGMKVYFYAHDLAEGVADGTNLVALDSTGGGVIIDDAVNGYITVKIAPPTFELDETVEDHIEGVWQVRWENSAGDNDTDEFSLEQPLIVRRNRVMPG